MFGPIKDDCKQTKLVWRRGKPPPPLSVYSTTIVEVLPRPREVEAPAPGYAVPGVSFNITAMLSLSAREKLWSVGLVLFPDDPDISPGTLLWQNPATCPSSCRHRKSVTSCRVL